MQASKKSIQRKLKHSIKRNQVYRIHFKNKSRTQLIITPKQRYSSKFLNVHKKNRCKRPYIINGINNIDNTPRNIKSGSRSIKLFNKLIKELKNRKCT